MTLRLVTICTHNRTRSVLMGALLNQHLVARGVAAEITSAGTLADGQPATLPTIQLLAGRHINASHHVSHGITARAISRAQLVVTAEVSHVVHVAGCWKGAFDRTFTLPELVQRGEAVGGRDGRPLPEWLADVGRDRPRGQAYLVGGAIPEVDDPTGRSVAVWDRSFAEIDQWCERLAELIA